MSMKSLVESYFRKDGTLINRLEQSLAPRVPQAPKERIQAADKVIDRVNKDIQRTGKEERWKFEKYIGSTGECFGSPYKCLNTDGHRAILVPANEHSEQKWPVGPLPENCSKKAFIPNPEFILALNRVAVASKDNMFRDVKLQFYSKRVELSAKDFEIEARDFVTWVDADEFEVTVNHKLLEVALGKWPITIYFQDRKEAISIVPNCRSFIYVLMPLIL